MQEVLNHYFEQLQPGEPWIRENLTLIPIYRETEYGPLYYVLLDEAVKQKTLEAREIDGHGRVNEIQVINRGEKPVLILDGEELVGAKQNRLVNTTLLIPALIKLLIPVSCVERGRWQHTSTTFNSSQVFGYSSLRRQKAAQVADSLREEAIFASDQHAVWKEIERKQAAMGSRSDTSAMHEIYVNYEEEMQKYMEGLKPQEGQIGVMVFTNGSFNCLDILGHPASLEKVWNKLLRSYAMEAVEARKGKPGKTEITPTEVLNNIARSKAEFYKSPGDGTDFRIQNNQYIGAGLIDREQVLHFSAFPSIDEAEHEGNMARPSRRRRSRG
jgi:hypothetical protein